MSMAPRPDTGQPPDFIEAVFTCKGDYYDPNFPHELETFNRRLQLLLNADHEKLVIKKVEPWNSVKVTVNIPKEAAEKLKVLASENNGAALRNMGIMSLQMEGDRIISLTLSNSSSLNVPDIACSSTGPSTSNQPPQPSTSSSTIIQSAMDISSNSTLHNLLNLPSNDSSPFSDNAKGLMQPPPNVVAPLVIAKPKPPSRQRKTAASRSAANRSRKPKGAQAASSATKLTTESDSTSLTQMPSPLDIPSSLTVSTSVGTTSADSVPATTSTITYSVVTSAATVESCSTSMELHPALKDTNLAKLPVATEDTAVETKLSPISNNLLVASLFERSLATMGVLQSRSPPQEQLSKSSNSEPPETKTAAEPSPNEDDQLMALHVSIPESSGSLSQPVNLSMPHISLATPERSTALDLTSPSTQTEETELVKSEHVSVIARPPVIREPVKPCQTEAMDLTSPGRSNERLASPKDSNTHTQPASSGVTQHSSCEKNSDLPMDLSSTSSEKLEMPMDTSHTSPDHHLPSEQEEAISHSIEEDSTMETGAHLENMPNLSGSPTSTDVSSSKASAVIEQTSADIEELHTDEYNTDIVSSSSQTNTCSTELIVHETPGHCMNSTTPPPTEPSLPSPVGHVNGVGSDDVGSKDNESTSDSIVIHGEHVSVICSTTVQNELRPSSCGETVDDIEQAEVRSEQSEHSPLQGDTELITANRPVGNPVECPNNSPSPTLHANPKPTSDLSEHNNQVLQVQSDSNAQVSETTIDSKNSQEEPVLAPGNGEDHTSCVQTHVEEKEEVVKEEVLVRNSATVLVSNGPSTQQQLHVVDHEPAENGSSTSTDSGVVPGSPKSDICTTPPSVEEPNQGKTEQPLKVSEPDIKVDQPKVISPPATCNTIVLTSSHVTSVPSTLSTTPESLTLTNTNRPAVSILKSVRPPHPNNIHEHKARIITPVTTKVIPPEPKSATTAQRRAADTLSFLMNSQNKVSDVLLAAANAVTSNQPFNRVPYIREQPKVPVAAVSHELTQNTLMSIVPSGRIINKSRPHAQMPSTLVLSSMNDQLVLVDSRHTVQEQTEQTVVEGKPAYIIPKDSKIITAHAPGGNNLNKHHIVASGTNSLMLKEHSSQPVSVRISSSKDHRINHQGKASSHQTSFSVVTSNGPRPATLIARHTPNSANTVLHRIGHTVNTASTAPVIKRTLMDNSNGGYHHSTPFINLPGVRIINSTARPDVAVNSVLPTNITITRAEPMRRVDAPSSKVEPSKKNDDPSNGESSNNDAEVVPPSVPLASPCTVTSESIPKVTEDAVQEQKSTPVEETKAGDKGEDLPSEPAERLSPKENATELVDKTTADSADKPETVNGDMNDIEVSAGINPPPSVSPSLSVNSSTTLEVQTILEPPAAVIPSLSSPGQRKSGRVRTLRSPDPDYITPATKVRKRGVRQISEDNPSEQQSAATAPVSAANKKAGKGAAVVKPTAPPAADVEPPAPQTNGPTSRAKRSTRSSGISDYQALPTVYRKRSKR